MGIKQTLLSSIGQKVLLATSGLVMFLIFLVPHMGGNVLFLFGPDTYNTYAKHLHELEPLLVAVEIVLLVSIAIHMAMAFRVTMANRRAHDKRLVLRLNGQIEMLGEAQFLEEARAQGWQKATETRKQALTEEDRSAAT